MYYKRSDQKSVSLGLLAFAIFGLTTFGLFILYRFIFGFDGLILDLSGESYTKITWILACTVITDAIIFGVPLFFILKRRRRKAKEEKIANPNATPKTGGCWIATAVYGDPFQPEIETLRDFRDSMMDNTKFGHKLTKFYYKTSPPIADFISNYLSLRKFLKLLLIQPSVRISESILKLKQKNYSQDLKTVRKILRNRYFNRYSNHN